MSPLPLGLHLYRGLTQASAPVLNEVLRKRLSNGKETPERVAERRGQTQRTRPPGPLVWIHAVSVGETMSVLSVIEALLQKHRDLSILITTATVTSAQLVAQRVASERVIHQFAPLDHPLWIERFFAHWRPDLGLIMESEFWPNLLLTAEARKIPLVLLNARLSEKSYRGWQRAPRIIARLLSVFSLGLAQNTDTVRRLRALGMRNVETLGNLKFAAPVLPDNPDLRETLTRALAGRKVWLAASIHPGEDEFIAAAHELLCQRWPDILTIVVPRHPERGPQIAETFIARKLPTRRRSLGELPVSGCAVFIGDTLGELGVFYRLAPLVLMGGSLIPHGGQNPLEPARLGCAILAGPHTDNFDEIYGQLDAASALTRVRSAAMLAEAVSLYLADDDKRATAADHARAFAVSADETLPRILAALEPYLPQTERGRDARA